MQTACQFCRSQGQRICQACRLGWTKLGRHHQVLHPHHLLCVLLVQAVHADEMLFPQLLRLNILEGADHHEHNGPGVVLELLAISHI